MTRHLKWSRNAGSASLGFLLALAWVNGHSANLPPTKTVQAAAATGGAIASSNSHGSLLACGTGQLSISLASPLRVQRIDSRGGASFDWSIFVSGVLAAVVGAGSALIVGRWNESGIRRSLAQGVNAGELKDLQLKLDSFYGPYMQRSEANRLLAVEFKSHQQDPSKFRTLTLLIDPAWKSRLSKSDQTIVAEIVENDIALRKLILEHAGLIDANVMNYLTRAAVHFRLIELAFRGELDNLPKRFNAYVYPKQLDEVLRLEVRRVTDRCEALRRNSTGAFGPMSPLDIPKHLELPPWTAGTPVSP